MKTHSTNYINTFIEIAEDSPVHMGDFPPIKEDKKTVANHQFDMIYDHAYEYTSDDVLFTVFAMRKEIPENEWAEARQIFFSEGQPCFRSSPLTKRYGWGIHSDENGKVAMYAAGTEDYQRFVDDSTVKKVKAMVSKRR